MRASPKFFDPTIHLKGSGFKQGIGWGPFTLPDPVVVLSAVLAEEVKRVAPLPWLLPEPTCFWEAPRLQGPLAILCLRTIPNEIIRALAGETTLLELFIGLDGMSHSHINFSLRLVRYTHWE